MDWLTFIAEIVKALGWPVAAVVIAWMFRDQLKALLSRVRKGKLGPAEFEFEESVRVLKTEAAELTKAPQTSLSRETVALLASNPRSAIITSWLELEEAMRKLLKARNFAPSALVSPLRTIQAVRGLGLIDPIFIEFTDELRQLRNRATHEPDFSPSPESVLDYVRLARELTDIYQKAAEA
jgi:hypothetical protein